MVTSNASLSLVTSSVASVVHTASGKLSCNRERPRTQPFEQSTVLRDYLGDRFVDMFVSVKRTEQARFFEVVTELDFDWYLRNA